MSAVATDFQGRVYVFQRKDPPVMVFERDGRTCAPTLGTRQRVDKYVRQG